MNKYASSSFLTTVEEELLDDFVALLLVMAVITLPCGSPREAGRHQQDSQIHQSTSNLSGDNWRQRILLQDFICSMYGCLLA